MPNVSPEHAYKVVLETERKALETARDELVTIREAIGAPLAEVVAGLPSFAGPRSATLTKIKTFSLTLANWPQHLTNMIGELDRELVKYDRMEADLETETKEVSRKRSR